MYQMKVTMFYVNKHYENSLKQLKTASTNSPWAYIWEGFIIGRIFVSEIEVGGGLIFVFVFFLGGGGYYCNFTVLLKINLPYLNFCIYLIREI